MKRIYCYSTDDGVYTASNLDTLRKRIQRSIDSYDCHDSVCKLCWHGTRVLACYSPDYDLAECPVIRVISVNPVNYQVKFLKPVKR